MRNLSTAKKLWSLLGLIWLAMLLLVGWSAWETRSVMLEERKAGLKSAVEIAMSAIHTQAAAVERGETSVEDAQALAAEQVEAMRYDGTRGYLYIFDDQYRMVAHPTLEKGAVVRDFQSPDGSYLFRDLAEAGKREGGGFVDYPWQHEGTDSLAEKSSYMAYDDAWNWNIGTGVYIDDIDAAFVQSLVKALMVLLAIGLPLTLLMGGVIRGITKRLGGDPRYAAEVVGHIADGDLTRTTRLHHNDRGSLLHDIDRMRESLASTIGAIDRGTLQVNAAVGEISAGNTELSARTEQQAASLAETASSMEQLTATVRQNAEHSEQARTLASSTAERAGQGGDAMRDVTQTMEGINASAQQMTTIVETIDGIAFQTNILALNASVEAARAGEHGRGFAVVASEVRMLASRSADAAREIKTLIEETDSRVADGSRKVSKAGETIQSVVGDIGRLNQLINEISAASQEQRHGIEQVNLAVNQMDQMTQQNAGLVEESASSSARLAGQSESLRSQVARFRIAGASGAERTQKALPSASQDNNKSHHQAVAMP